MAVTYSTIATTTLSSAQANIDFSSFSGYTDLILVCNVKTAANTSMTVRVGNGSIDTGTNYSYTVMEGNGSLARSGRDSNSSFGFLTGHYAAIVSGNEVTTITQFKNYAGSTNKTWVSRGTVPAQWTDQGVGLWRSTSAITVLRVLNNSGANFSIGSTFTLYGIASA